MREGERQTREERMRMRMRQREREIKNEINPENK